MPSIYWFIGDVGNRIKGAALVRFAFQDSDPDTNTKPYSKFPDSNPVPLVVGMWVGTGTYSAHSLYPYIHKKSTSFHLDKCQAGVDVEGFQQLLTVDIPPDMEKKTPVNYLPHYVAH